MGRSGTTLRTVSHLHTTLTTAWSDLLEARQSWSCTQNAKSLNVRSPNVRFSDLADDLRRLLKRREHFRGLLPPQPDVVGLGEQRADLVGLVE